MLLDVMASLSDIVISGMQPLMWTLCKAELWAVNSPLGCQPCMASASASGYHMKLTGQPHAVPVPLIAIGGGA